jgi:hypothetical protein
MCLSLLACVYLLLHTTYQEGLSDQCANGDVAILDAMQVRIGSGFKCLY